MKSLALAFAAVLLITSQAYSQAGDAGFQILKLGYSARDLSLSASGDAVSREPVAVYLNPAGLAASESQGGIGLDVMMTHRTYIAGTTIDMFGSRFQAGTMSFGTSLLLSSVPDIPIRTVAGPAEGTFSAKDFAFAAGVAHRFGGVDVGISAMYLYEKLFVYESSGYAFNAGVQFSPLRDVRVGISAGNLGNSSAMISQRITLPAYLRVGGSYTTSVASDFALTGYLGVVTFKSGGITPSLGADLSFQNLFDIRAGYGSGSDLTGFSYGAGIHYGFLKLDYSYVPLKLDFGNSQTFTLSFLL